MAAPKPPSDLHLGRPRRAAPTNRTPHQLFAFLTPYKRIRIIKSPHADVAELADAQVSEACDGDIVEVQVLSSAPNPVAKGVSLLIGLAFFRHHISNTQLAPGPAELGG